MATQAEISKALLETDVDLEISWAETELPERERTKHVHRLHPYLGKFVPQLVDVFLDRHFHPRRGDSRPVLGQRHHAGRGQRATAAPRRSRHLGVQRAALPGQERRSQPLRGGTRPASRADPHGALRAEPAPPHRALPPAGAYLTRVVCTPRTRGAARSTATCSTTIPQTRRADERGVVTRRPLCAVNRPPRPRVSAQAGHRPLRLPQAQAHMSPDLGGAQVSAPLQPRHDRSGTGVRAHPHRRARRRCCTTTRAPSTSAISGSTV